MYEKDEGRRLVDHCQHLPWPGDMRRVRLSEKSWRPTKQRMGYAGCSGYTAQGWKKTKGSALTKASDRLRVRFFIQAAGRKERPSGDKSPPSFFSSEMNLLASAKRPAQLWPLTLSEWLLWAALFRKSHFHSERAALGHFCSDGTTFATQKK